MIKRNLCVVAVIGAGLIGGASVTRAETTGTLLASWGKFQLDNGDTKVVMRGPATKGYRVCMVDRPAAVPLKVTYDGKEDIVAPGECHLIEATKIKLSSASRLHAGMTLIGSFNGSATKHYQTDVSVARAARND